MDKIREVVAHFLNINPQLITNETRIGKVELRSSIFLRRMYSELLENGYKVEDIFSISTFGDLLSQVSGYIDDASSDVIGKAIHLNEIGVDIEIVSNLPDSEDFREELFYKENFTQNEIAHCLLSNNPKLSFTGLYCLKEAIIKIDNSYSKYKLSELEILHNIHGAPYHSNFWVSISHTSEYAVGIAVIKKEKESSSYIANTYDDTELFNRINSLKFEIDRIKRKYNFISYISLTVLICLLIILGKNFLYEEYSIRVLDYLK